MRKLLASLPLVALAVVAADVRAGDGRGAAAPAQRVTLGARQATRTAILSAQTAHQAAMAKRFDVLAPMMTRADAELKKDPRAAPLLAKIAEARGISDPHARTTRLDALGPEILALRKDIAARAGLGQRDASLLASVTLMPTLVPPPPPPGTVLSTQVITSFPNPDSSKSQCPDDDDTWKFSGPSGVHITASGGPFNRDCAQLWAGRQSDLVEAPPQATRMTVTFTGSVNLDVNAMALGAFGHSAAHFAIFVRAPDGGALWPITIPASGGSPAVTINIPQTAHVLKKIEVVNFFYDVIPVSHSGFSQSLQEGDALATASFDLPANRTTNVFEVIPNVQGMAASFATGEGWMSASMSISSVKVSFIR